MEDWGGGCGRRGGGGEEGAVRLELVSIGFLSFLSSELGKQVASLVALQSRWQAGMSVLCLMKLSTTFVLGRLLLSFFLSFFGHGHKWILKTPTIEPDTKCLRHVGNVTLKACVPYQLAPDWFLWAGCVTAYCFRILVLFCLS